MPGFGRTERAWVRRTPTTYRRQLLAGESPRLPGESAYPENQSCVTTENPPNAPTGSPEASPAVIPVPEGKTPPKTPIGPTETSAAIAVEQPPAAVDSHGKSHLAYHIQSRRTSRGEIPFPGKIPSSSWQSTGE